MYVWTTAYIILDALDDRIAMRNLDHLLARGIYSRRSRGPSGRSELVTKKGQHPRSLSLFGDVSMNAHTPTDALPPRIKSPALRAALPGGVNQETSCR
jgi:hypothetical protein